VQVATLLRPGFSGESSLIMPANALSQRIKHRIESSIEKQYLWCHLDLLLNHAKTQVIN
jgi:hypothetical protein